MNYTEQDSWGSHNALSLDASIALSAGAALASLVFGGLAATLVLPLACVVGGGIAVALLRHKRQKQHGSCKIKSCASHF